MRRMIVYCLVLSPIIFALDCFPCRLLLGGRVTDIKLPLTVCRSVLKEWEWRRDISIACMNETYPY